MTAMVYLQTITKPGVFFREPYLYKSIWTCNLKRSSWICKVLVNQKQQEMDLTYTVKPAHTVTSIKQSHVLKGHPFLVLS